jgi:tRNA A-37 threonylcarbamoyl transferase component Bud32
VREPHIVHLYGAGIKGRLLMVMEYCHRGSLYDVLRDESLEFGWDRFFHFAIEVATAVSELHRNNVLHRDLKTLNLLVLSSFFFLFPLLSLSLPLSLSIFTHSHSISYFLLVYIWLG